MTARLTEVVTPTEPVVDHVTAVVVSWNTVDLLDECLRSLRDFAPVDASMDVVVVDNGSTDRSTDLVHDAWPAVTLIDNDDNVGFCRANNQAIRATEGDWLLLINADAMVHAESIDAMLDLARREPRAGIVAPRLVYGDGSWQRWTAGRAPSLRSMAPYLFGLDRFEARSSFLAGHYLGVDTDVAFRPDWVSSACMLVRRDMLDQIGLLDESIFVYMDDVELCQRARDHGWDIWYEPGTDVTHLMGQSTKRRTGKPSPAALRGFNRYFLDRHGPRKTAALRSMQAAGFGLRVGLHRALAPFGDSDRHRSQAAAHLTHLRLTLEPMEQKQ